jgi:hypothetical protein
METGMPDEHPSKSAIAKTDTQLLGFMYAPEHSLGLMGDLHTGAYSTTKCQCSDPAYIHIGWVLPARTKPNEQ